MSENRELSIAAAMALVQAASRPQSDPGMAEGCILASELRPGDVFYRTGRVLGSDDEFMIIELTQATVLSDGGFRDDLDLFGRSMRAFWCRNDETGAEGWCPFGPRGVVRIAPEPPYYVLSPHAEQARQDAAELSRWEGEGGSQ